MILSRARVKYSIRINIISTKEAGLDAKVVGIASVTRLFDLWWKGGKEVPEEWGDHISRLVFVTSC